MNFSFLATVGHQTCHGSLMIPTGSPLCLKMLLGGPGGQKWQGPSKGPIFILVVNSNHLNWAKNSTERWYSKILESSQLYYYDFQKLPFTNFFQRMFKQPPQEFGKFKLIGPEYYDDLYKVLLPLLPRSRRILATLQLTMKGTHTIQVYWKEKHVKNVLTSYVEIGQIVLVENLNPFLI